eukprot:COSAG04_NODE_27239_length_285_cov_0.833333_1_plen_22_part_01
MLKDRLKPRTKVSREMNDVILG